MSPARIPEGSVFIARRAGENIALQLLEAAEQIGADRNLSVRTVSGGYHVFADVAEQYQANLPEQGEVDEAEGDEPEEGDSIESEEAQAEAQRLADEKASNGQESQPSGVTLDNSRDEIDDYASRLTPPIDTTKAANKSDAIKLIEEALKPQTPAD